MARARLANLGYPVAADIELAVAHFQIDYRLEPLESLKPDGSLPDRVLDELRRIWDDRICDAALPASG